MPSHQSRDTRGQYERYLIGTVRRIGPKQEDRGGQKRDQKMIGIRAKASVSGGGCCEEAVAIVYTP